jgi:dTDP-4-dehydrorhamnose reductase
MAGHIIKDYLSKKTGYEVWYTIRGKADTSRCISLDVMDEPEVLDVLERIRPDVVINAAGLLNQNAARRQIESIYVNSIFPHKLAKMGERFGYRLVHISTDCVFSGDRGGYTEADIADGTTIYAKTKSLGEVAYGENITVRTSIIGPELKTEGIGLFHWFMQQKGNILGYRRVFWNGITTLELAKAIEWILKHRICGLVHLAATEKLSKYELLKLLKEVFNRDDVVIQPYDELRSDKSLVNTRSEFSFKVADYREMLEEMKKWVESGQEGLYPYA